MVEEWGGGRGSSPIFFPLPEDGRGGPNESKTQKTTHNKVRYIVTRMLHLAKPLLRCIVFEYEGRLYPVGEPLGTPGGCTWNLGAATLRHRKAAVESGLVRFLMAWHAGRPVDQAFSARTKVERQHAVLCIHTLKNPQGAVLSAQNGAFLNRSAGRNRAEEKGPCRGLWRSPKPTSGDQPHRVVK